jgi:hypothetical protein
MAAGAAATSFALICVIGNKSELSEFDPLCVQYFAVCIPLSLSIFFSSDERGILEFLAYLLGKFAFVCGFYLFVYSLNRFAANLLLGSTALSLLVLGVSHKTPPLKTEP